MIYHESGVPRKPLLAVIVGLWTVWVLDTLREAIGRVREEDATMRNEFGREWEEWAKKTRYRLIPLVY